MNLTPPFKAVCIDDKNRPNEIPTHKWVKQGEPYTVVDYKTTIDGTIGFTLAEIDLKGCFPYEHFAARRFAVVIDDIDFAELEELISEPEPETA